MARSFGYRPESTYGVENTSADIKYLEVNSCTLDAPSDADLDIETIEETPSRTKRGFYSPSGDVVIALDIPTMIDFLYFTFGNKITDDNIYELYPGAARALPSFTAYVGKDDGNTNDFEHVFYGCVVTKLSLSLSDGIAVATMSVQAQKDGKNPLKSESEIEIDDTYPIAFYEAQTKMGTTDISSRTTSLDFEFDNKVTATNGQAFNSMFPYRLPSSGKEPTVKTTVFYTGYDLLVQFWGSNNGPVCNTTYNNYTVIFTDENDNVLTLYFPKFSLNSVPQTIEGSEEIKQDLALKILKSKVTLADETTSVRTSCLATVELADEDSS